MKEMEYASIIAGPARQGMGVLAEMFAALLAVLTLATPGSESRIVLASLPSSDTPPAIHNPAPRTGGEATPAPPKRVFVLGIRFQNRGGAQGIALERVVEGSPADRAGFTVGMVIAEIEGKSTARPQPVKIARASVQEAGTPSSLSNTTTRLTFKLRTRTVRKRLDHSRR